MTWYDLNYFFQIIILSYFIVINFFYGLLTIIAFFEVKKQYRRSFIDDYDFLYRSKLTPGLSLLVPAFNEKKPFPLLSNQYLKVNTPVFRSLLSMTALLTKPLK